MRAGNPAPARPRGSVTPLVRVTGIGGVFFRSDDPKKLMEWYRKHLGIKTDSSGGWAFQWREKRRSQRIGRKLGSPRAVGRRGDRIRGVALRSRRIELG